MATVAPQLGTVHDGRQSPAAFDICRGVARLLRAHGLAAVGEVALANGRRADVAGISDGGAIWIVEIKSCLEDFRTDQKWPEYREFCDRLFFAVAPDFPREVLPPDTGLIIADRYGGEIIRPAPEHKLRRGAAQGHDAAPRAHRGPEAAGGDRSGGRFRALGGAGVSLLIARARNHPS